MLASHFPKAIVWGPARITLHNDAFLPILAGKGSGIGRPFDEIWAEVWPDIEPIWQKAMAGQATFIENFGLQIDRKGYLEEAFFTFCYSPIFDDNGQVLGMMDTVVETTRSVAAFRQAEIANAELNHRMRNLITMISSIARQTLRGSPELAQKVSVFQERLSALADAQSLMTNQSGQSILLEQLASKILHARVQDPDLVDLRGPALWLGGHQASAISLALNELVTNGIKYGALSQPGGQITLDWRLDGQDFSLAWTETGGPTVAQPARVGFGSTLLTQVVPAAFHGNAELSYEKQGLSYLLRAKSAALG